MAIVSSISFEKVNLNRFWEKTPSALKYFLVFSIFIITAYFIFSKTLTSFHTAELSTMKKGIVATYELIDNFEEFRREQDQYNKEVLNYIHNLHALVEDLNATTNRKLDMILSAGNNNSGDIIEKIQILSESFDRLSRAYQNNMSVPNLDDNKAKRNYLLEQELKIGVRKKDSTDKK